MASLSETFLSKVSSIFGTARKSSPILGETKDIAPLARAPRIPREPRPDSEPGLARAFFRETTKRINQSERKRGTLGTLGRAFIAEPIKALTKLGTDLASVAVEAKLKSLTSKANLADRVLEEATGLTGFRDALQAADDNIDKFQEFTGRKLAPDKTVPFSEVTQFMTGIALPFGAAEEIAFKALPVAYKAASPIISRVIAGIGSDLALTSALFPAQKAEDQTVKNYAVSAMINLGAQGLAAVVTKLLGKGLKNLPSPEDIKQGGKDRLEEFAEQIYEAEQGVMSQRGAARAAGGLEEESFKEFQERALRESAEEGKQIKADMSPDKERGIESFSGFINKNQVGLRSTLGLPKAGKGVVTDFLEGTDLPSLTKKIKDAPETEAKKGLLREIQVLKADLDDEAPEAYLGAIDAIRGQRATRGAEAIEKTVRREARTTKKISKELEPLVKEARKFKTAEEFVKSEEIVYHGSPNKFSVFDESRIGKTVGSDKEGIFFTNSKILADRYTFDPVQNKRGAVIGARVTFKNPLEIKVDQTPLSHFSSNKEKIMKKVKSGGHDGVRISDKSGDEDIIIALSADQVKTTQQLTDIFNKAKEVPTAKPKATFDPTTQALKGIGDSITTGAKRADDLRKIDEAMLKPENKAVFEKNIASKIEDIAPPKESEPIQSLAELGEVRAELAVIPSLDAEILQKVRRRMLRKTLTKVKKTTPKKVGGVLRRALDFRIPEAGKLKDISTVSKGMKDIYRNFETVFGENISGIRKTVLEPFDDAKARYVVQQEKLLDDLYTNIVKGLDIKKGSKMSRLVQELGEGTKQLSEVVKEVGEKRAKDVSTAAKWFRKSYDDLLDEVNSVARAIYPNNPEKIIPKRKDYFRHFQELNGIQGLRNLFENTANIDPKLSGVSDFTVPNSKWQSFKQKRLGAETKLDAVGGFLEYIPNAAYSINIDPQIKIFRKLSIDLAEQTGETKNVNNFIEFLQDFSNDLAGKTNPADRALQKYLGRKTMRILNSINSRVKMNVILGNFSSSIAQIFNVPTGIGQTKLHAIPGLSRTFGSILGGNKIMNKSRFISERYLDSSFNKFDTGILENTRNAAVWVISVLDEVGTKFIWNANYEKAIKGLKLQGDDAIRFADDQARKAVAGRGIGEVPLLQKAKTFQLIAPFQLEVGNVWWAMKDFVNKKDFGGLVAMMVATYYFNQGAEKIRGSGVSFDPINALIEAAEEDLTVQQRFGRLIGEVVSNIPVGQTIAAQFVQKGKPINIGDQSFTPKQLFGEGDPTRFGGGLLVSKGISDPLTKLLMPFAGMQVKRTIEGLRAVDLGRVTTRSGEEVAEIKSITDKIKAPIFGKWSVEGAKTFFSQEEKKENRKLKIKSDIKSDDIENAMKIEKKLREDGMITEASNPVRDALRKKYGVPSVGGKKPGNVPQDKQDALIEAFGVMNDVELDAYIDAYKSKTTQNTLRFFRKKAKTEGLSAEAEERRSEIKSKNFKNEGGFISTLTTYAKAIGIDPLVAFNRIFTGQKIERVDNGAIIVKRLPLEESQGIKKFRSSEKTMKLDHTIPRQLGGSNAGSNLKLVSEKTWKVFTGKENELGRKLRNGEITKDEAQEQIKAFKSGFKEGDTRGSKLSKAKKLKKLRALRKK